MFIKRVKITKISKLLKTKRIIYTFFLKLNQEKFLMLLWFCYVWRYIWILRWFKIWTPPVSD